MNTTQLVANIWRSKTGKLTVLLVVACLCLAGYLVINDHGMNNATNKSVVKTSNPGSASSAQSDLLPVTTSPGVPDTSGINSPDNSGQNIQSQPDSTPNTSSPQQAASSSPEQ